LASLLVDNAGLDADVVLARHVLTAVAERRRFAS
jgi:hypothetical protein